MSGGLIDVSEQIRGDEDKLDNHHRTAAPPGAAPRRALAGPLAPVGWLVPGNGNRRCGQADSPIDIENHAATVITHPAARSFMPASINYQAVLSQYSGSHQPTALQSLGGGGGFSGALLWKLTTLAGPFCLRRWPAEHPSAARLAWIHDKLRQAADSGLPVPAPVRAQAGAGPTFVSHGGHLWELAPWMPGAADYHQFPHAARLASALTTLARFHQATTPPTRQSERAAGLSPPAGEAPSQALLGRLQLLDQRLDRQAPPIFSLIDDSAGSECARLARVVCALFVEAAPRVRPTLAEATRIAVPHQPVIRDVWHDHLLFAGNEVSGLIDFGAMRVETVAGDIARLLGSLERDHPPGWQAGLAAYEAVRPLSPGERTLVAAFDQSSVLLSGMNWLTWLYVERRRFESLERVAQRLREIVPRLERLHASGA